MNPAASAATKNATTDNKIMRRRWYLQGTEIRYQPQTQS